MGWKCDKIGFEDGVVTVVGVLFFSFFIPIVFFGWRIGFEPRLSWVEYVSTMIVTGTTWIGARYIMIWARTRYPSFGQVRRRLWVQNLTILAYALLVNNVLGYLLLDKWCKQIIELRPR